MKTLSHDEYRDKVSELKTFDDKLEFDVTLIPYTGSDAWVKGTILDLKKCLDSDTLPASGEDCDYCRYREAVEEVTG